MKYIIYLCLSEKNKLLRIDDIYVYNFWIFMHQLSVNEILVEIAKLFEKNRRQNSFISHTSKYFISPSTYTNSVCPQKCNIYAKNRTRSFLAAGVRELISDFPRWIIFFSTLLEEFGIDWPYRHRCPLPQLKCIQNHRYLNSRNDFKLLTYTIVIYQIWHFLS